MKSAFYSIVIAILAAGCATLEHDHNVHSVQLVKSCASWDGRPLPAYPAGTPEVTILRISIPPKHTLPMHMHPVINAGVLLKGELTVVTENGAVLHMRAGDPIVEVVGTWHYGRNEGHEPAEIIVFYAGEKDNPITVKKSEEQAKDR